MTTVFVGALSGMLSAGMALAMGSNIAGALAIYSLLGCLAALAFALLTFASDNEPDVQLSAEEVRSFNDL